MCRSYLYVPASDERRVTRALDSCADAVVLDLEDSVLPDAKAAARRLAGEVVGTAWDKPVYVRVNALASIWAEADLALRGPGLTGFRLPKVAAAADVEDVRRILSRDEAITELVPLIESAAGLEEAAGIAAAPNVVAIAMGEADLRADLGVRADAGLDYARGRCVAAAAAAGRFAIQSVYTDVSDHDGLARSTATGRDLGLLGRSVIHPAQAEVVNEVLTPTTEEQRWAEDVLASYEKAAANGHAVAVTTSGGFIDPAVVRSADRIRTLARLSAARP